MLPLTSSSLQLPKRRQAARERRGRLRRSGLFRNLGDWWFEDITKHEHFLIYSKRLDHSVYVPIVFFGIVTPLVLGLTVSTIRSKGARIRQVIADSEGETLDITWIPFHRVVFWEVKWHTYLHDWMV
jgi:hypothetical protein